MTIQGRRKFGDVALELEVIDEPTLTTILQEQVRHKLARCMHWDAAQIEREDGAEVMPVPPDGEVFTVQEVLVLAARRHYGPSRVRARLGDAWDTPLVFDDRIDLSALRLDEEDSERVKRLHHEPASALAPSPEADRSLGTLLIALWLVGAIELPAETTDAEPGTDEDFESGLSGTFGVRSSRDRLLADSAFLQGRELFEQGEYAAAADAYETACGLRPRAREYALALAWARNLANGSDEASLAELQALCEAALAQDRHLGLAYHVRGHLAVQRGETERAREELHLAVAFDPSDRVSAKMLQELPA